jgi:DNA-binding MarR family transcriptional regulator
VFLMEESVGFMISRLANAMRLELERRLAPFGITAQQWTVLMLCHTNGAVTPSRLAEELGVDGSAVTRLLDRLEKKRLLERKTNPNDRRSIQVELLDDGRSLAMSLPPVDTEVMDLFLRDLSGAEQAKLKNILRSMMRSLELRQEPLPGGTNGEAYY